MYDWANSAFITIVVAAIFPPYFMKVASSGAAAGTASYRLAVATTIARDTTWPRASSRTLM